MQRKEKGEEKRRREREKRDQRKMEVGSKEGREGGMNE